MHGCAGKSEAASAARRSSIRATSCSGSSQRPSNPPRRCRGPTQKPRPPRQATRGTGYWHMTSYPIPPRVAEQAARDYLAIRDAGLLDELDTEIGAAIEAHYGPDPYPWPCPAVIEHRHARRLDRWQWRAEPLRHERDVAADLAQLLDCPAA